jgi:multiple sugar transport system substrate-binding protein
MHIAQALKRFALAALTGAAFTAANAGTLVLNHDSSNPEPKAAFEALVKGFEAANPDIKVKVNVFDHEGYKTSIRNFLTAEAPDVVAWYPGNRMAPFINAGLFEDVSDVWAQEGLADKFKSADASMTMNGKKWGVPYTYYQWGIYYRKDVFAKAGITEPKSWKDLVDACAKLKAAKIIPFTVGSKESWPTAGWFDYLNLRINGYDFHMQLTSGKVPYNDKRVLAVFDKWDELVKPGYFLPNHGSFTYQDALAPFVKGEAAMMLIGNFAVPLMRNGGLKDEQIGFFAFPTITDGVARAEDAPTDTLHIPSKAKNKSEAKKFLAYLAKASTQAQMNQIMGQLPVNKDATVPNDPFLKAGFAMLSSASALAQFYDRDAPAEMAKAGMDGFQRYMLKPQDREDILKRLEQVRQRVYK